MGKLHLAICSVWNDRSRSWDWVKLNDKGYWLIPACLFLSKRVLIQAINSPLWFPFDSSGLCWCLMYRIQQLFYRNEGLGFGAYCKVQWKQSSDTAVVKSFRPFRVVKNFFISWRLQYPSVQGCFAAEILLALNLSQCQVKQTQVKHSSVTNTGFLGLCFATYLHSKAPELILCVAWWV